MPYADPRDQARYAAEHYAANKDLYKARAKASRAAQGERVRRLIAAAKAVPCQDCGQRYPPYVMEFDHLDPSTKSFNISDVRYNAHSLRRIKVEIAKCEVVCANCHRERTHKRRRSASQ
jgi:hypothetical protein